MADSESKPWLDTPIIRPLIPQEAAAQEPETALDEHGQPVGDPAAMGGSWSLPVGPNIAVPTIKDIRAAVAPTPGWEPSGILPMEVKVGASGQPDPGAGVQFSPMATVNGLISPFLNAMEGTGLTNEPSPLAGKVTPDVTLMLLGSKMGRSGDLRFGPPEPAPPGLVAREAAAANPPPAVPKTSAEAKQIASGYYDFVDKSGGTLQPQFTNRFVDSVGKELPQTEAGKAVAGENAVTQLQARLQSIKDQPLTLKAAQEIDEHLGDLIDKEYGVTGLSKEGKRLADVQSSFRDQIMNAEPGDIAGSAAGFDALSQGRKAWSLALKMRDLERIQERALLTDNPATSVRVQLRSILTNDKKLRGYSDEEVAALRDAANRGVIGSALHVFGSRLIPIAAFAGDGLGSAAAAHVITTGIRGAATALQASRLDAAIRELGRSVPPPLRNQLGPQP